MNRNKILGILCGTLGLLAVMNLISCRNCQQCYTTCYGSRCGKGGDSVLLSNCRSPIILQDSISKYTANGFQCSQIVVDAIIYQGNVCGKRLNELGCN